MARHRTSKDSGIGVFLLGAVGGAAGMHFFGGDLRAKLQKMKWEGEREERQAEDFAAWKGERAKRRAKKYGAPKSP